MRPAVINTNLCNVYGQHISHVIILTIIDGLYIDAPVFVFLLLISPEVQYKLVEVQPGYVVQQCLHEIQTVL